MSRTTAALAAAAIGLALPAAAQAQTAASAMVRAQDPASVVAALQAYGLRAELGTDKVGDPMIGSAVDGTAFQVLFYNCKDNRECATVQFHAGYDHDGVSLNAINEWNRSQRFGRAFLDKEDDPILEMDLDLDDGGLSRALFIDNVEFWEALVPRFEEAIGFDR
ncbi:YbjN domain-containing protein [Tsuneonella sp. HG249]